MERPPKRGPNRGKRQGPLFTLILIVALVFGQTALGLHQDEFQLDGSIQLDDQFSPAEDYQANWDDIFDADGNLKEPLPIDIVAATFIADDIASPGGATDGTTFTGSNKNSDLISTWTWGSGNVADKSDISNAYAIAVINEDDELVIYAGLERISVDGDTHADFEFNQSAIGLAGDGTFTGTRQEGDLLVSVNFVVGGSLADPEVYVWTGTEWELTDPEDNIRQFSNTAPIAGGEWPSYDKHGTPIDTLPTNAFYEIGINITAIFGETETCVSATSWPRLAARTASKAICRTLPALPPSTSVAV